MTHRIIELASRPPCKVHLSPSANLDWIAAACEKGRGRITTKVQELFGDTSVVSVDVFGPAAALPSEKFGELKTGNSGGHVGVVMRQGGQDIVATQGYSTMGGSLCLQKFNPGSVADIIIQSLDSARKTLQ